MSNKPIFVATHPRACSTAFERVFMTRTDTLQCVHEPFGDAFYFGPERLSERYENDEKTRIETGFSESTFKTIFDRIERENSEVGPFYPFYFCFKPLYHSFLLFCTPCSRLFLFKLLEILFFFSRAFLLVLRSSRATPLRSHFMIHYSFATSPSARHKTPAIQLARKRKPSSSRPLPLCRPYVLLHALHLIYTRLDASNFAHLSFSRR